MYSASCKPHKLQFIKPARTSRGEMLTHDVYYVSLTNRQTGRTTWGEAAPLPGLSIDARPDIEAQLSTVCMLISEGQHPLELDLAAFPSIRFALESALLQQQHKADHVLFDTDFTRGISGIPINGLVWMAGAEQMLQQAGEKIDAGFSCIKFKVGALDFDEECRMLEAIRKRYSAFQLEIRLDANGAFNNQDVLQQLKDLSRFDIHSIEQPVKAKQWDIMQEVCAKSPIDIALDEELIGIDIASDGQRLLRHIGPAYIILKPTLVGGLQASDHWISLAGAQGTGWWATSALESNIGLNAIAQWVSNKPVKMLQGLGTGALYCNNIISPLYIEGGELRYNSSAQWENLASALRTTHE
jgi:O-succinylbenzoate synthase